MDILWSHLTNMIKKHKKKTDSLYLKHQSILDSRYGDGLPYCWCYPSRVTKEGKWENID
jgi:hypothetical protein